LIRRPFLAIVLTLLFVPLAVAQGSATKQATLKIDAEHSVIKMRVGKAGIFSALAHDHEIEAPIAEGQVECCDTRSVTMRVESAKLRVKDPGESPSKRNEIQETMLGPKVLDTARFPDIRFVSSSVEGVSANRWRVFGDLTIHGKTLAVSSDVTLENGHYRGALLIRQTDFGMTPVTVAGGSVKVKNEIRIDLDIQTLR